MAKNNKSFLDKLLIVVAIFTSAIAITLFLENNSRVAAKPQSTYESLEEFSKVLDIIEKSYVEDVDTDKVVQGAIKGMLSTLDPHSSYLKPDDFKELTMETKGSFTGIGIEITMKDGFLTVVSPIEGTPAFKKGLQAGDKIIKINDEPTNDLSLMEAVKRLRGQKGSEVSIAIHREGWSELKDIKIIRDEIPLHSVKSKLLEPGYPYIRIINFQERTTNDFKDALKKLTSVEKPKGLVIDLRNNPGGLLDQSVQIADIFIDDGVIVSTKGRIKDQNRLYNAHANGPKLDCPIVVLVNEGSASASEIVAGALKDHKKAIIMGAQTFGKGSVQTILRMDNGAGLRLTTARYYTPNGTSIQTTGITPDIIIPTEVIKKEEADDTDENDKKSEKQHLKFLREKDLKGHIENGQLKKKKGDDKKENNARKLTKEEEETREQIERDPQLKSALGLLKGLNVFSSIK
jgi:carboxyl-terminal processing protease